MKKRLLTLVLLFVFLTAFAQEKTYKEYSFSQLFEMIEAETDSVFELKDAIISYNKQTDSLFASVSIPGWLKVHYLRNDTIVINKALKFNSVFFDVDDGNNWKNKGMFHHIKFLKKVEFVNSVFDRIDYATFYKQVTIQDDKTFYNELTSLQKKRERYSRQLFRHCHFKEGLVYFSNENTEKPLRLYFEVFNSIIETTNIEKDANHTLIRMGHHLGVTFINNTFKGPGNVRFITNTTNELIIEGNTLKEQGLYLIVPKEEVKSLIVKNNDIGKLSSVNLDSYSANYNIGWRQFKGKIADWNNYNHFELINAASVNSSTNITKFFYEDRDAFFNTFLDSLRIQNEDVYKGEIAFRSKFLEIYNSRHDTDLYNLVYTEIKDLETERLEYLYDQNPSFKTYFTWKVNQFLKVFSAYGTEPARSIIFSVYVILLFALIYLFFPNSWDSHGKNRIVDRYNFFFKYMNQKTGMHDVYLEDQKEELMSYDQFKSNIINSEQKVPKFFTATALPLYKWAVSGTKLSATLLKYVDIMKGTWSDLPTHKRYWKSVLLISAFLIAILYDIFIKMLNALMLSINTFTTLGFGEIPIKGLPRYLAIIQGFIGWFMLTIFSVSLISQLLN